MDVYIGLDVSLASTAICVVSAQGKVIKETTAASEPEELLAVLQAMPGSVVVVGLEAGPLSQWLYRHLSESGFVAVLMETRQVKGVLKAMPILITHEPQPVSVSDRAWAGFGRWPK